MEPRDLLPERYRDDGRNWQPGRDTMDVWFDSGSSWKAVVQNRVLEVRVG